MVPPSTASNQEGRFEKFLPAVDTAALQSPGCLIKEGHSVEWLPFKKSLSISREKERSVRVRGSFPFLCK